VFHTGAQETYRCGLDLADEYAGLQVDTLLEDEGQFGGWFPLKSEF
jgi:hypothetical protein